MEREANNSRRTLESTIGIEEKVTNIENEKTKELVDRISKLIEKNSDLSMATIISKAERQVAMKKNFDEALKKYPKDVVFKNIKEIINEGTEDPIARNLNNVAMMELVMEQAEEGTNASDTIDVFVSMIQDDITVDSEGNMLYYSNGDYYLTGEESEEVFNPF